MAEYKVPTKTYTYYETPQLFKIFTFFDEDSLCDNFIIQFQLLGSPLEGIGVEGDLIVTVDAGEANVDSWLDDNGDLFVQDYNGTLYFIDLSGDVIFEC